MTELNDDIRNIIRAHSHPVLTSENLEFGTISQRFQTSNKVVWVTTYPNDQQTYSSIDLTNDDTAKKKASLLF